MIVRLDVSLQPEAQRVLELQRASYAVEAKLIGFDAIPPLHEPLEELQSCGEVFHGFLDGQRLLGFVSHKFGHSVLDIHRVAVHPEAFGRGVARALLGFVLRLEPSATRAIVQTASRNLPACRLYATLGFEVLEQRQVPPGLELMLFAKALP